MPKSVSCVSIKSSTLGILHFFFIFYPPPPLLSHHVPLGGSLYMYPKKPFLGCCEWKRSCGLTS
jgi:hypothetical protein